MITLIQDGFIKACEGITTLEEVMRVSKEKLFLLPGLSNHSNL